MRVYLLDIRELLKDSNDGSLCGAAFEKVDAARREKVQRAGTLSGKAAGLGAGLLLQRAVRDWNERPGTESRDRRETCLRPRVYDTVSELLAGLPGRLPLTYRYGSRGKPYFADIPLCFNISHSGDYVLLVSSEREVGADIQKIQKCHVEKLSERFLDEEERKRLRALVSEEERERAFFQVWVKKEAWGKLTGQGLPQVLGSAADEDRLRFTRIEVPAGYRACVCEYREGIQ